MPTSKAQQKAVTKYDAKTYDKFLVRVLKGRKEEITAHAQGRGKSLNGFVNEAIDEKINRDMKDGE